MDPFYRIRFADGATFDYSGDRARCAPRSQRFSPGRRRGYERFLRASEAIYRIGFEQLGDVPFDSLDSTWRASRRTCAAARATAPSTASCRAFFRDERLRVVFSFHPLLIGGNPFPRIVDLLPDRLPRAALGRPLRDGRHRRAGRGPGRADRRAGRRLRCDAEVGAIRRRERRGDRRPLATASASPPTSSSPTPIPPGPTAISCPPQHAPALDRRQLDRARYSMGLFVWYFGTRPPLPRRRATTRSCWARATASC